MIGGWWAAAEETTPPGLPLEAGLHVPGVFDLVYKDLLWVINTKHHSADVVRTILLQAIVGAGSQDLENSGSDSLMRLPLAADCSLLSSMSL